MPTLSRSLGARSGRGRLTRRCTGRRAVRCHACHIMIVCRSCRLKHGAGERPNIRRTRLICRIKKILILASLAIATPGHAQFAIADLALNTHISQPAFATLPVTLTVIVTNLGPDYVTDVNVENQLPDDSAVISTAVAHSDHREFPGSCFVGTVGSLNHSVSCSVGSISPNEFATITVIFRAADGGNLIHSYTFAGLDTDANLANNTVDTSFAVLPAAAIPTGSTYFLPLLVALLAIIACDRIPAA